MIRLLLVLVCLIFLALVLFGMRVGWRNRLARQSGLPALPVLPTDPGPEALRSSGLYVGTTFAASWQDRVVHERLSEPAAGDAVLYPAGVVFERAGSPAVYLPSQSWVAARLAPGLAGKVMGDGGLLVVRWQLGPATLDSAFRADDKSTYPEWVSTINEKVAAA